MCFVVNGWLFVGFFSFVIIFFVCFILGRYKLPGLNNAKRKDDGGVGTCKTKHISSLLLLLTAVLWLVGW